MNFGPVLAPRLQREQNGNAYLADGLCDGAKILQDSRNAPAAGHSQF